MPIQFSGTSTEISLKNSIHNALVLNELGSISPYRLSHAGLANSGYSFGYVQWDLASSNQNAIPIFREILEESGEFTLSQTIQIVDFVSGSETHGSPNSIVEEFGQSIVDHCCPVNFHSNTI